MDGHSSNGRPQPEIGFDFPPPAIANAGRGRVIATKFFRGLRHPSHCDAFFSQTLLLDRWGTTVQKLESSDNLKSLLCPSRTEENCDYAPLRSVAMESTSWMLSARKGYSALRETARLPKRSVEDFNRGQSPRNE